MHDIGIAIKLLESKIKSDRLSHCLRVMQTSLKLAERFGVDCKKAELAGLLHDCAKDMSNDEAITYCRENNLRVDDFYLAEPGLLHGPIGADIARKEFHIDDSDILNAIYYHTTGRKGMSVLEKIIYIADLIEPSRDFPGVQDIRETVWQNNLNKAILQILEYSAQKLIIKGKTIHPNSIEARKDILRQ